MLPACHRHRSYVTLCEASFVAHSGRFPVLRPSARTSAAGAGPALCTRTQPAAIDHHWGGLRVDDAGVRRARKEDDRKSADDGASELEQGAPATREKY